MMNRRQSRNKIRRSAMKWLEIGDVKYVMNDSLLRKRQTISNLTYFRKHLVGTEKTRSYF